MRKNWCDTGRDLGLSVTVFLCTSPIVWVIRKMWLFIEGRHRIFRDDFEWPICSHCYYYGLFVKEIDILTLEVYAAASVLLLGIILLTGSMVSRRLLVSLNAMLCILTAWYASYATLALFALFTASNQRP